MKCDVGFCKKDAVFAYGPKNRPRLTQYICEDCAKAIVPQLWEQLALGDVSYGELYAGRFKEALALLFGAEKDSELAQRISDATDNLLRRMDASPDYADSEEANAFKALAEELVPKDAEGEKKEDDGDAEGEKKDDPEVYVCKHCGMTFAKPDEFNAYSTHRLQCAKKAKAAAKAEGTE
jgi:protein-arginine kinase activator protein McsA